MPTLQKCICVLLGELPAPTKYVRYMVQGELQAGVLSNSCGRKGYAPFVVVEAFTIDEAVNVEHERFTTNQDFNRHKDAVRRRKPYPEYKKVCAVRDLR